MLVADLFLIALSTIGAELLRDDLEFVPANLAATFPYLGITLIVAAAVLVSFGVNRTIWRFCTMMDYVQVVFAAGAIATAAAAIAFATAGINSTPRSVPVMQLLLMGALMLGARALARRRQLLRGRSKTAELSGDRPGSQLTVLIVGLNRVAELYLQSVAEFGSGNVSIAGILANGRRHIGRLVQHQKILGTPEEALAVIRTLEVHGVTVDRVVVTRPLNRLSPDAQAALREAERTAKVKLDLFAERAAVTLSGDLNAGAGFQPMPATEARDMIASPQPAEGLITGRKNFWRIKRTIDFLAAAFLIVALAPLGIVVALIVAADLGMPVTFWQQRPGAGGRPFKLRKFRTMGPAFDWRGQRIEDGRRVSWIGRFLRRAHLDELPQLYNILIGEMSFVGPRPLLPADQPSAILTARLLVRPGLTGWAQIKGGREIPASDKAALDLWYVRNASFALDLKILMRTALNVTFRQEVDRKAILQAWRQLRESGLFEAAPLPALRKGFTGKASAPKARHAV